MPFSNLFLRLLAALFVFSFTSSLSAQNIDDMLDEGAISGGFEPLLKIGIKVDVSSFSLEGDADILNENGKIAGRLLGRGTASVKNGKIAVSGKLFHSKVLKFRSELTPMIVGGKMFRGEIEIHLKNGLLTVVNDINIEDYVRGVINKEALPSWPLEAKKSQAVLARTFAVYQKIFNPRSELFDLSPSVLDQVYDGLEKEDVSSNQAVDETKGEIATLDSRPAKIYFHSTCGGTVSSSAEIWKIDEKHLQELRCPYCKESPLYRWTRKIGASELEKRLKSAGIKGKIRSIKTVRGKTRVLKVVVNKKTIPVNKFRELVGFSVIWSNDFSVKKSGGSFVFEGKGAGHGVGVCQWGMAKMAKLGKSYREILNFYLKGIEIRKMY